ncbi:GTP-binding protein [Limnoraphis robusta Tam1]|uniref:GTP-binding protein n=1 Tax=Limnoraphis robusta CCNP1315 TaxID=3110306 RepID=A0ABU5U2R6_9CYAN|nr:GTP-binding protein [Limnoraphis robusta]MEA5497783.1 GTP-binding protein [Limnoraphis robusta BA-68 BA1]MEA5521483.1 GTP-binding protein [Limnoraphis robusta CCNP1315]MEA5540845.1 GTP-binding protein [Limnoraphis robusta Tam1]MEA5546434.1 GTP-binding protein [Limnoraphis robusta CCNP1324]
MNLDDELNNTILSFTDIQAELNLRDAQDAMREIVAHLDLTPQERAGLETELEGLDTIMDKLEQTRVQIAVFGMVGRGKSSILNALLGQNIFETGPIHGVTQATQAKSWQVANTPPETSEMGNDVVSYRISQVELIDTPGIDEVDGKTREEIARQVAQRADLLLFVIAGDITQVEYQALSQLREAGKPMLLVFNKVDQYPEADRMAIYHKIRDERVKELLSPDEIVMAAASPLVAKAIRRPDGSIQPQLTRSEPQVEQLKLKILDILDREGKSLVALNTMLYAGEINEQLVQRKMEIRDESANRVIWNGVMTKSVAIALNPMTVIDLVSGAVIDVMMILTLSKLYGISMTQKGAIDLLQKIAISMGGITASELVANLGLSSLKGLLGVTAPMTGGATLIPYLSVAMTQAAVAGVSSYGIGQVTKTYLANGASWGDEAPKAVVKRILASLDETSILNRIKAELQTKLDLTRHSTPQKRQFEQP